MKIERSKSSRFEGDFGNYLKGFGNGLVTPSKGEVPGYFQFLLIL